MDRKTYRNKNMKMPRDIYTHEYVGPEQAIFFTRGKEITVTIQQEKKIIVSWEKHFI